MFALEFRDEMVECVNLECLNILIDAKYRMLKDADDAAQARADKVEIDETTTERRMQKRVADNITIRGLDMKQKRTLATLETIVNAKSNVDAQIFIKRFKINFQGMNAIWKPLSKMLDAQGLKLEQYIMRKKHHSGENKGRTYYVDVQAADLLAMYRKHVGFATP